MKLRFKNVLVLTVIFIMFIALFTNPKKDAYVGWCKEEVSSKASNSIEKGVIAILGGPLIQTYTTSHNYVFFTIYNTSIDSKENLKVIGIFNNFIPISKSNNTENINATTKGA